VPFRSMSPPDVTTTPAFAAHRRRVMIPAMRRRTALGAGALALGALVAGGRLRRAPGRGDLVVVARPGDRDLEVVKRVVGLPGERLRLHPSGLEVDGPPLPEPYPGASLGART